METLLNVENLCVGCAEFTIVKNVSFQVQKGQVVGIVGESGCGKSTMLKSIVDLSDNNVFVQGGQIQFNDLELTKLNEKKLRALRGAEICMIFQKPETALDPLIKVRDQFFECVKYHSKSRVSKDECYKKSKRLLEKLHFDNTDRVLNSYSFELSGGMNQRVALAMAMINEPQLILADEPTSALDVSVQSQVVRTMVELRENYGTSILMVTHNMNIVAQMVDVIGVMYGGRLVELGSKDEVLNYPMHPYTRALIDAIPQMDGSRPVGIDGVPPSFSKSIAGCPFSSRCGFLKNKCDNSLPPMAFITDSHWVLCHNEVAK
ncbi:MAG: ABC transporter ATP-binding protein [Candidatus ainarchaeum sp.]|jgi:oligopeptide/dipeptide ABC transporter ATP-binding protein|nr:ABC transporter ATP-binding protein [Candidatus ainarchaeum sp.]MDD4428736.1 ABC transporter ATP-binding protein [Paludibacter sp.]